MIHSASRIDSLLSLDLENSQPLSLLLVLPSLSLLRLLFWWDPTIRRLALLGCVLCVSYPLLHGFHRLVILSSHSLSWPYSYDISFRSLIISSALLLLLWNPIHWVIKCSSFVLFFLFSFNCFCNFRTRFSSIRCILFLGFWDDQNSQSWKLCT